MRNSSLTYFDSPDRSTPEEIASLKETVLRFAGAMPLLEGYPSGALLLSKTRQIVTFNSGAATMFGWTAADDPTGKRFGEAVGCIHSADMSSGCGTSKFCKECGFAKALRFTRERQRSEISECRISARRDGRPAPLDIRAVTSPVQLGERLTLAAFEDISPEKHRNAMARVFFDEVGSAVTSVVELAQMIEESDDPAVARQLRAAATRTIGQVGESVQTHRDFIAAENGELAVTLATASANALLERARDRFGGSPLAEGKRFTVESLDVDAIVYTDVVYAARSLGNLVKNALEASAPGDAVRVWAEPCDNGVVFRVSNPQVMPESVQLQMFQRSFTSKPEDGRGIGTYIAKLVVEEYLHGEVTFTSAQDAGTVFTLRLPAPSAREQEESLRFDDLLVRSGSISADDLRTAREHADRTPTSLAEAVVTLGYVSEEETYRTLARACRLRFTDLLESTPEAAITRLVPERVARRHSIVGLRDDGRVLTYAVSRPFDDEADRDLRFVAGRQTQRVLAKPSQIAVWLDRLYPSRSEFQALLDRVRREAPKAAHEWSLTDSSSPVIQLCNLIVSRAVELNASDIHMEPSEGAFHVRYRLSGILEQAFELPAETAAPVTNRFKIMSGLEIFVRQRPQDGAFRTTLGGRDIDVRVSTLPTIHGEKIVMRVIDAQVELSTIERLGYDGENLQRLRRALARPDGLVLVSGPTGSGKTTVLYAALNHLRTGRTNIVTVEDPVERRIEGVNQIAVNNRAGATFAAVLRSVLRQDPNVIMVGEIRDAEVAQIVGQAAYTGHLVLSTVHASDAASAITRLLNLGLEPFKVAESVAAIVAQRLIRKVCPACAVTLPRDEAERLGASCGIPSVPIAAGPGCDRCKNTGYVDRVPVVEVLVGSEAVRATIAEGVTTPRLRAAMRASGCLSMRESALAMVGRGETTLDEINRVLVDEAPNVAAPRETRTVLVADNDPIVRMLVRTLLEHDGFEVIEAENGREALELARGRRPSLAVVDLRMPEIDGFAVIEQVRADPALGHLPVIVLTDDRSASIQQRVLDLGADDYLVKPFEREVLTARVRAIFRRIERTLN